MTPTDAIAALQHALDNARPGCPAVVSTHALAVVLRSLKEIV